jgi:hypothetical protein
MSRMDSPRREQCLKSHVVLFAAATKNTSVEPGIWGLQFLDAPVQGCHLGLKLLDPQIKGGASLPKPTKFFDDALAQETGRAVYLAWLYGQ